MTTPDWYAPKGGNQQSAQGSALGMRATHTNALNGQKRY